MAKKTMKFKTELEQLLHLITHSLYSHREVFLRELISNSCDAIDKARFEGLTNTDLLDGDSDWKIALRADKEAKTLTISDNGIGMSKESVIENLGTIAHSGTKAFLAKAKEMGQQDNPDLIGQFGVGFCASFMVADDVTVITKAHGEEAVQWESKGTGSFTLSDSDKETRGTDIILHLKEDAAEYLDEWTLRSTVKKFSDFLEHPVVLFTTKKDEKTEEEKEVEEQINTQKAIWLRQKSEIKAEEYAEFYKHVSHDMKDPAETIHYNAEGAIEFKALLFVPKRAPFDMFETRKKKNNIKLYVRRVFIMDDCEDLIPEYLNFVRGVVDSDDLPLNISRENLQQNKILKVMKKNIVKKCMEMFSELADNKEDFKKFYEQFSKHLEEGLRRILVGTGERDNPETPRGAQLERG